METEEGSIPDRTASNDPKARVFEKTPFLSCLRNSKEVSEQGRKEWESNKLESYQGLDHIGPCEPY